MSITKFATFADIPVDWRGQGNPTIRVQGLDMRLPERFLVAVDENGLHLDWLSPRLRRDLDRFIEGAKYRADSRKEILALENKMPELTELGKGMVDCNVQAENPKTYMHHGAGFAPNAGAGVQQKGFDIKR